MVVDYVGPQPWVRYKEYKVKYPKHGGNQLPPGQAKKMDKKGYVVVPANGGYYTNERHDEHEHYDKHENKGKHKDKGHGKH